MSFSDAVDRALDSQKAEAERQRRELEQLERDVQAARVKARASLQQAVQTLRDRRVPMTTPMARPPSSWWGSNKPVPSGPDYWPLKMGANLFHLNSSGGLSTDDGKPVLSAGERFTILTHANKHMSIHDPVELGEGCITYRGNYHAGNSLRGFDAWLVEAVTELINAYAGHRYP